MNATGSGAFGPVRLEDRAALALAASGGEQRLADLAGLLLKSVAGGNAAAVLASLLRQDPRFALVGERVLLSRRPADRVPGALPLEEVPFAVVDFETTGYGSGDRAIEVGVCCFRGGREEEAYETLLDPGVPPSPFVVSLTGIRPEDLQGRPEFPKVWPILADLFRHRVVVAHNLPFDLGVLNRELVRHKGHSEFDHGGFLCTLKLARRLVPRGESRGLDALAERFGLCFSARHRALDDARMTGRLLYRLAAWAGENRDMRTWGDLQALLAG